MQHLYIALLLIHIHVDRLQIHGAGINALAAADANGVRNGFILILTKRQQRSRALPAGNFQIILRHTHHGPAHDHLPGIFQEAAGLFKDPLHGGTHTDLHIFGLCNSRTGDSNHTLYRGPALITGPVHAVGRKSVENIASHIRGQSAWRHLSARDGFDQCFLCALWILAFQRNNLNAHALGAFEIEKVDSKFLIQFNAKISLIYLTGLHNQLDTLQKLIRVLQHCSMIAGYIGLAFCSVDDHGIHLAPAAGNFKCGGERGTAHSHDASLTNHFRDLLRRLHILFLQRNHRICRGVLKVVLNHNRRDHVAQVVQMRRNGDHFSGDRRMDRRGNRRLRLSYFLAEFHLIADSNQGRTGCAYVLRHRDDHLRWLRYGGNPRFIGRCFLVVRMHAAMRFKEHEHHL